MIVYCIRNIINNKEYIGLTTRPLEKRWKQHIYESNRKNSWEWNTPLGNAIKKYGKESFEVFVLIECQTKEEMKQTEIRLIKERKTLSSENGYNLSFGGDGRLGYKLSEETKKKIGEGNRGKYISPECRMKMSIAAKKRSVGRPGPMCGRKHTDEAKRKITMSSRGRIFSEESRRKRSDSMKKFFKQKKQLEIGILDE